MDKNTMNITNIEDFFYFLLYGKDKLTEHLFFTSLPMAIEDGWDSMVLVDVSTAIEDLGGCGKGVIAVYNYAVPNAGGIKNSNKLAAMDNKLNELIQSSKSEHYFITRYRTHPDYDSERNLHCNITLLNIQII